MVITPAIANQLLAWPASDVERRYSLQQDTRITVRLNANENPYGPSDKARRAVADILREGNRYPFQVISEMKSILAAKEGLTSDHISIGAGSAEILCAAGTAFAGEGGEIVSPFPTFPMLMGYAELFKARWQKINVNERLEVDYEALAAAISSDTKLVFICNPNNPTGTLVEPATVSAFCEDASRKTTVFADEAYLEFLDPAQQRSMVEHVRADRSVIVSRTFSKIFGLAGLRVGYAIGRPDLIKKISQYQSGFSVSQTALAAARASMGDEAFMAGCRRKNAGARKILTDYLEKKGYFYGKSYTNFVFFDPRGEAERILKTLAGRGIGIRVWDYNGKLWNRISVGTEEEMKTLVRNLEEIV